MPVYNKLVRDRIPEVIERSGKSYTSRVLTEPEYREEIRLKLHEELAEYESAEKGEDALGELADLLELLYAAAAIQGATVEQLEKARRQKAEKRGAFNSRIYLMEVEGE